MMADGPNIEFTSSGHAATLTLANEARHNCIGQAELEAMIDILDRVADDRDIRVVVVTGRGDKSFSSGFDLKQLAGLPPDALMDVPWGDMLERLRGLSKPTVAALNGAVYGGGSHIALACDFRIGVDGMVLQIPAGKNGLVYQPSGIKRMTQLLGPGFAQRALIAGETFTAQELLRLGFVDWLIERRDFAAERDALAARLAAMAPLAVAAMKSLINDTSDGVYDEAKGRQLQRQAYLSDDFAEAVSALKEKREPDFTGK
jgi:enoyl-CoA hydratase/carnithine racemase